jgi:predicted nuclease with TOPRIM domain
VFHAQQEAARALEEAQEEVAALRTKIDREEAERKAMADSVAEVEQERDRALERCRELESDTRAVRDKLAQLEGERYCHFLAAAKSGTSLNVLPCGLALLQPSSIERVRN